MKTSQEYEKEFLDAIVDLTGKNLKDWMTLLKGTSLKKMKETTVWLKTEQGLKHSHASFIAGIYLNDGKPVFADSGDLFGNLFDGKEDKKPLYDALAKKITSHINNIQIVPTKTYVSFRDKKEFATAKINKTNIRVGLDLGDMPFGDYVEKGKSLGAMPRISHMIEIHETSDINAELLKYVKQAYDRVHG